MVVAYKAAYEIGQIVYLVTDPQQLERMITAIQFRDKGTSYELVIGDHASWHTEVEISEDVDQNKRLNLN